MKYLLIRQVKENGDLVRVAYAFVTQKNVLWTLTMLESERC